MTCPDVPFRVRRGRGSSAVAQTRIYSGCRPGRGVAVAVPRGVTRAPDLRETGARQSRHQLQCVLIVQLPQRLIGQADAVELPEGVVVAVVVEVLVVGLEHPPVVRKLVGLVAVLAE